MTHPIEAAHKIADHLDAIAALLPDIAKWQTLRAAYLPGWEDLRAVSAGELATLCNAKATALRQVVMTGNAVYVPKDPHGEFFS